MSIHAAIDHEPGGHDRIEATGVGKGTYEQRKLEGAGNGEELEVRVRASNLGEPVLGPVDDVVVPLGLNEGESRTRGGGHTSNARASRFARMEPSTIHRAVTGDIRLGESPVWSEREQVLYWIDIDGHAVHRLDPSTGVDESRPIGARPGACALTHEAGRILVATEHQLVWLDWATGTVEPWVALEDPSTGNRCNDGRVDPTGHMVVGTMWPNTRAGKATGSLYRIAADGSTQTLLTDLGVPNGLAFDADRGLVYYADTSTLTVLVADYDADTGDRRNVRPFLDYNLLPGKPDGACLDVDGCYWSASIYAWSVIRVTPDGRVDRRVELPVEKPTMPAFGGPDLSTLYVTSIGSDDPNSTEGGRDGFTPGDLMALDVGVQGRPETPFAGL